MGATQDAASPAHGNPRQTLTEKEKQEEGEPAHDQACQLQPNPITYKHDEPHQVYKQETASFDETCSRSHTAPDHSNRDIQQTQDRLRISHGELPRPAGFNNTSPKGIQIFEGNVRPLSTM